ncbi:MAG: hypothetical protein JO260_05930 [Acidobacteria bacterium]|nr:hypothetical protein [Acidobacteriota bacterium]
MTLLNKFGIGPASGGRGVGHSGKPGGHEAVGGKTQSHGHGENMSAAVGTTRAPAVGVESTRVSNGLKELMWNLDGLGRGTMLDMGGAWQATLSFFIEKGFRVTTDDLLRAWKQFLDNEEKEYRERSKSDQSLDLSPAVRANRFFESNIQYPISSFDVVLLWDLLDYLDPAMATRTVAAITDLLRPGGVVFTMFHSKKPEGFQRYRVADAGTLQVVSANVICPAQRVYQNREIQDLFGRYRTAKSFIARDQLRENLFIK